MISVQLISCMFVFFLSLPTDHHTQIYPFSWLLPAQRRPNRSEQHHRDHRVHISQRRGPFKKRLKEEQLFIRLVLLFRCPIFHHGWNGGRLGRAHVHRPPSTAANRGTRSWLPPRLCHNADPQLSLSLQASLALLFPVHGPVTFPRHLAGGPEGFQRAAVHRDLNVHAPPGHPEALRHAHRHLQLWEGPQLPSSPQLYPERPKRLEPHQHSEPPHHACMRTSTRAWRSPAEIRRHRNRCGSVNAPLERFSCL